MSFENEYVKGTKREDPLKKFYPAIGFILMLSFAAIAFVLYPFAQEMLAEQFPNFPQEGDEAYEQFGYIVAGSIFVLLMLFFSLLYALFAARGEKQVTEKELKDEKRAREQEKLARKRRKKKIQQEQAKERKRREKEGR